MNNVRITQSGFAGQQGRDPEEVEADAVTGGIYALALISLLLTLAAMAILAGR